MSGYGIDATDEVGKKILGVREQLYELKQQLTKLERSRPPRPVEDYTLTRASDGNTVRISELFGDMRWLVLVHNMGMSCPYCTMWADGFNGLYEMFTKRFAFFLVSPDTPEQQRKGAAERNWRVPMLSASGHEFTRALGFPTELDGQLMYAPGASTFIRDEAGKPLLMNQVPFGPGDDFNPVFAFAQLFPHEEI